jgi:hypothetical protein
MSEIDKFRVTDWVKATASNANGTCVELRRNGTAIEVRDTKDGGGGPILGFTPAEFASFLDGAVKGEFNHLL